MREKKKEIDLERTRYIYIYLFFVFACYYREILVFLFAFLKTKKKYYKDIYSNSFLTITHKLFDIFLKNYVDNSKRNLKGSHRKRRNGIQDVISLKYEERVI